MLLAQGCAGTARQEAVPEAFTAQAVVPGLPDVRYRVGIDNASLLREGIASVRREQAHLASQGHQGSLPPAIFLAISGGGDSGAFGAGLLNGWTAAGNRPEFKLVTGVSTGALIAPFAFLGPAYDESLNRFYTTVSPDDIVKKRSILAAVTGDALADNAPLRKLVAEEVDQAFLDAVAREYEKGRLLLVATTDLDARQAVIWNMTKIAASRDPKALDLFRSLMVASAAIPGAFPPTMIDVEANGKPYQEMHVDGGTMSQVFIYPSSLRVKKTSRKLHIARERKAYVIRNARLDPDWAQVDRWTMDIAGRAVSSLIDTQGIGDLYRIYTMAQRDGVDFNLAYIPASFNAPHKEEFDTEFMKALFKTGYDMAAKGYPWEKAPPVF
jgi:predicted acylesterase/phospholipase RssA